MSRDDSRRLTGPKTMAHHGKQPQVQAKRRRRILVVVGLLLFTLTTSYAVVFSRQIRCQLAHWSDLTEVNPSLFVDPQMPSADVPRVSEMLIQARQRVAGFYGEARALPVIIVGHDQTVAGKYLPPGNRTATTYLFLGKAYVVLGPDGLNIDVLAHELMHAELSERIGWLTRERKIPTWFDSGLAMQADDREGYSEKEWQRKTDGGKLAPSLDHLTTARNFYTRDYWVNYATSKHEVGRWFAIVGRQGLEDFLKRIKTRNFTEAYQSVEKECTGQNAAGRQ